MDHDCAAVDEGTADRELSGCRHAPSQTPTTLHDLIAAATQVRSKLTDKGSVGLRPAQVRATMNETGDG